MLPAGDAELVQIMDRALADATVRSGPWLLCRPGCNPCCTGVFAISALDAERLQQGLRLADPPTATAIRERVADSLTRLQVDFPGEVNRGVLGDDEASQAAFEDFANDEVCPVLNPATGACDLYAHRPMTCRTFGPPVRNEEGGLAVCELCFAGAPEAAVAAAELHLPDPAIEAELSAACEAAGPTIVAFALRT